MKQQVNPAVFWVVIGVVAVIAVFVGYKVLGPGRSKFETTGSEEMMKKVQSGQPMYTPPAAVDPRASTQPSGMMSGAMSHPPGMGGGQ